MDRDGTRSVFPSRCAREEVVREEDMKNDSLDSPREFLFLLLDNFSMISYACAIEPLRLANRASDRKLYGWSLISENGRAVRCSNGSYLGVDSELPSVRFRDTIVVCSGVRVKESTTPGVINWLRRESRKGVKVVGTCTGAYVLAKAGLLNGKRATIHWENRDSFVEEFPDVDLCKAVFAVDRNRLTTAGGVSSIDLMLQVIAEEQGEEFAATVADQLIYNSIRTDRDAQRLSIPSRIGVRHPKLAAVIQVMEENIEEPISPSILAKNEGMSTRQLERLFRRYLDRSPKRYYMEIRLQRARNLLMQTDMTVMDVAIACGFGSPSHFSKSYRSLYNTTPYRERGAHSGSGCQAKVAGAIR